MVCDQNNLIRIIYSNIPFKLNMKVCAIKVEFEKKRD